MSKSLISGLVIILCLLGLAVLLHAEKKDASLCLTYDDGQWFCLGKDATTGDILAQGDMGSCRFFHTAHPEQGILKSGHIVCQRNNPPSPEEQAFMQAFQQQQATQQQQQAAQAQQAAPQAQTPTVPTPPANSGVKK